MRIFWKTIKWFVSKCFFVHCFHKNLNGSPRMQSVSTIIQYQLKVIPSYTKVIPNASKLKKNRKKVIGNTEVEYKMIHKKDWYRVSA